MIATPMLLKQIAERSVPERPMSAEFFDALEHSVAKYGLHPGPSMAIGPRGADGVVRLEPRNLTGHALIFAIGLDEKEPDLAQRWLEGILRELNDLDLTPQLVGESVVAYNTNAQRRYDHPLSWTEACLALGLRRYEGA